MILLGTKPESQAQKVIDDELVVGGRIRLDLIRVMVVIMNIRQS